MYLRDWTWTLVAIVSLFQPVQTSLEERVCNGHVELCSRSYSNVTFVGSHNSFAFSADPFALARNQEINITAQLNLGVRLLQAQSHENDGVLHFCHTSCLLFDGGPVVTYLKRVKQFLDENPNEVLTLLFTNPEGVDIKSVWRASFDQAGITPFVYVPPAASMKYSDWPTLGEMIDNGKRVVVFMDAGANTTAVDFILPEFEMIWETPFDATNDTFPCSVDRIHGPLPTEDHMYMINHGLNIDLFNTGILVPDAFDAPKINGVRSIIDNVNECAPLAAGRAPTFILLDFVNYGQGIRAANELNGFLSPNARKNDTGTQSAVNASLQNLFSMRYVLGVLASVIMVSCCCV